MRLTRFLWATALTCSLLLAPIGARAGDAEEAAAQGHALYGKKKYRQAASYFSLAVTYDSTHADYYYWASMCHSAAMEDEDAYEWIRGALSLDETNMRYHVQHGRVCSFLGNPGEAAMAFEKALALGSGDAQLWADYGLVLKQSGRAYQAMEVYRKALAQGHSEVAYDLGQSLMELQDPDQAVGAFRQAVAADPGCMDCYLDLGDALMITGDTRAALSAYGDAQGLAPDDWRPRQRSIRACYALSDFTAADVHKRALQKLYDKGQVHALADLKAYVVDVFEVGDLTVKAYEYYDGEGPEGVHWTFQAFDPTGWMDKELAARDAVAVAAPGRGSARRGGGMELVQNRENDTPMLLTSWTTAVSYPTVRTAVIAWLQTPGS